MNLYLLTTAGDDSQYVEASSFAEAIDTHLEAARALHQQGCEELGSLEMGEFEEPEVESVALIASGSDAFPTVLRRKLNPTSVAILYALCVELANLGLLCGKLAHCYDDDRARIVERMQKPKVGDLMVEVSGEPMALSDRVGYFVKREGNEWWIRHPTAPAAALTAGRWMALPVEFLRT